jgi:hypothetical protein
MKSYSRAACKEVRRLLVNLLSRGCSRLYTKAGCRRRQPQSLESEGQFDYKMSRPSHCECIAFEMRRRRRLAVVCSKKQNARVYFGTKNTLSPLRCGCNSAWCMCLLYTSLAHINMFELCGVCFLSEKLIDTAWRRRTPACEIGILRKCFVRYIKKWPKYLIMLCVR